MPKTGSKALQTCLLKNSEILYRQGICFSTHSDELTWHNHRAIFEGKENLDNQIASLKRDGIKHLVLSYEAGYLASEETIEYLSSLGAIRGFLFLRNPVDWTNSFLNQLVKAHRITYDQIINFSVESSDIIQFLDVDLHIDRWKNVSSNFSITYSPYHHQTDVIGEFSNWLGLPKLATQKHQTANPNPAADLDSLQILLEVKKRLQGKTEEELAVVINQAHKQLKGTWINTLEVTAPKLLRNQEINTISNRYLDRYNALLGKNNYFLASSISHHPDARDSLIGNMNTSNLEVVESIIKNAAAVQ